MERGSDVTTPGGASASVLSLWSRLREAICINMIWRRRVEQMFRKIRFVSGIWGLQPTRVSVHMSSGKPPMAPRDLSRVCIADKIELAYWSDRFDVPAQALKQIVRRVGPAVGDVAREIRKVSLT